MFWLPENRRDQHRAGLMMLGRRAKKAKRKRKRVTVVETDELGAGAQVHGAQSLAHGQAQILAQAQGHGIEVLDQAFHRAQAQAQAVAQGMVQPPGQQRYNPL